MGKGLVNMVGLPNCVYDLYDDKPKTCGYPQKTDGMTKDWYFCTSRYQMTKCKKKKGWLD
jgi:hypothetical protein